MKKIITFLTLAVSLLFASPAFAYSVKPGDTMSGIAREHHLTLKELADENPHVSNLNLIYPGQEINTNKTIRSNEPKIEEPVNLSLSNQEIDLLARLVRAEAQTEPLEGKIAVACVVLNRVESSQFPDTIKEVIYAPGQFQPVQNGQINKPADEESIQAVKAALSNQRQLVQGALFFYNPTIATSRWLDSRATTHVIGQHVFKL
ncbi:cell wall hydrolase [Neobacillus sp. 179-C4.2 HS]|uniref:Cell wall hydrolase n=1 Tax=Neobacillus driksii TaxID=3035913 RepID=A0ABV4YSQ4_9BACI|nr:cell wall hydrolase [Neobacillus sp. 179.-C4.2 HS]MDP5193982.1 cell wall hydrolase [Neobacillus sp. 179.-C4.2 HS]